MPEASEGVFVANSMELSTTRAKLSILWNPKVHRRIHKSSPLVSILSQTNPIHTISFVSPKSILILSTHLRLGLRGGLFRSRFPQISYSHSPSTPSHATCPAHLILLDLIIQIIFGEEYKSRNSLLCCFLHPPITSSLFQPTCFQTPSVYVPPLMPSFAPM
jgi:hypothetical protein